MVFNTPEDLLPSREQAATSLSTRFMPLGNISGMTEGERTALIGYLQSPVLDEAVD